MSNEERSSEERKRSLSYPLILMGLGTWVFIMAQQLPVVIRGGQRIPGPKYFPSILSGLLALIGLYELIQYLRELRSIRRDLPPLGDRARTVLTDPRTHTFALILAGLIVFVPLIRTVGFLLGGVLFATLVMVRLRARPLHAIALSIVVTVMIGLLFGQLFRIPLPRGFLGIGF